MARRLAPLGRLLALLALGPLVGAAEEPQREEEAISVWTELRLSQPMEKPLELLVRNDALSGVRLASCEESYPVAAGGNATVPISGLSMLWVVPEELDAEWNCSAGPFDLFYMDMNLTGSELAADVGFGLFEVPEDEKASGDSNDDTQAGSAVEGANNTDGEELPAQSHGVAGVELSAMGVKARCRPGICGDALQDPTNLEALVLTIRGFDENVLSFWHGSPRGSWKGPGWGRPVWGGRRGGRWSRRRWAGVAAVAGGGEPS